MSIVFIYERMYTNKSHRSVHDVSKLDCHLAERVNFIIEGLILKVNIPIKTHLEKMWFHVYIWKKKRHLMWNRCRAHLQCYTAKTKTEGRRFKWPNIVNIIYSRVLCCCPCTWVSCWLEIIFIPCTDENERTFLPC